MSVLLEQSDLLYTLTEAYFGKPKEFAEIEKRLEKIIEMVNKTVKLPGIAVDINKMKEVQEIETIFTKFFKNRETQITFYTPVFDTTKQLTMNFGTMGTDAATLVDLVPSAPAFNAFTIPSSFAFFKKDKNNRRLSRVEDLFINVNIDMGLIYTAKLTAKELMAVILHEIGHCFDASLFMFLMNFQVNLTTHWKKAPEINVPVSILGTLVNFLWSTYPIQKFMQEFNRMLSKNPQINQWMINITKTTVDISGLIGPFMKLLTVTANYKNALIRALSPRNIFGYAAEKFADSFATAYGYGPDIVSFQKKIKDLEDLGDVSRNIKNLPVFNIGYDLTKVAASVVSLALDEHPDSNIRIVHQLNKLKKDIKDPNLNSKIRKELEDNIKDIENQIDEITDIKSAKDGRVYSTMYSYLIIKVFNGKIDPRELFEIVSNHDM